jgi:hypothetical protein
LEESRNKSRKDMLRKKRWKKTYNDIEKGDKGRELIV